MADYLAIVSPCLAEFLGTGYVTFAVVASYAQHLPSPVSSLAIGMTLLIMVASMGHVSGAHFNPAVTFSIFLTGRRQVNIQHAVAYIATQLGAAAAVGFAVRPLIDAPIKDTVGQTPIGPSLAVEIAWTAALATTVLNSATNRKTSGNSFYPLSIGFAVTAGTMLFGPISGGLFNPAVTLALFCYGAPIGNVVAVTVGPIVGGIIAAVVYRLMHTEEFREPSEETEPLLQASMEPSY